MSVGNDVVDLADSETRAVQLHRRFDERVFGNDELAALRASDSTHLLRWAMWAAKESAYKACARLEPDVAFSPRAFAVELAMPRSARAGVAKGSMLRDGRSLDLAVEWNEEYVHAIAATRPAREGHRLSKVALANGEARSAVRSLAVAGIAPILGREPADIEIVARPPVVRHGSRVVVEDLSLSHHGRFVAFAAVIPAT